MAINQNHTFEDLNGVKCAIVEKGVPSERCHFLKELLEYNGYNVIVVSTPVKVAPKPATGSDEKAGETPIPETFTLGVTDVTFSPVHVIYGRQLRTPGGHVVTPAYWQQKETVSHDEIPYYQVKRV
jgi:hypothetical protein